MHRYWKFLPLLAVLVFGAVFAAWPQSASATPVAAPTWTGPGSTGLFTVSAMYTDDTPAGSGSAVLTAIGGVGQFVSPATVSPQSDEVITVSGGTVTVSEDSDTIPQSKTITASFQCFAIGTVTFTLSHGGTTSGTSTVMTCSTGSQYPGYGYPGYGYPTYPGYGSFNPLAPIYNNTVPSYGVATTVGVSASPASLSCGSASTVAVTVRDAAGNPVPDGTAVTLSASMGTIAPTTGNTSGGAIQGVFTSPASNGSAVITASSGSASGQATVSVGCGAASYPSQPSAPPAYAPPAIGTAIYPPNTGDAGLASSTGGSSRLPAALGVALMVLIGGSLAAGWSYRRERSSAR